jgi:hypothetical protein
MWDALDYPEPPRRFLMTLSLHHGQSKYHEMHSNADLFRGEIGTWELGIGNWELGPSQRPASAAKPQQGE